MIFRGKTTFLEVKRRLLPWGGPRPGEFFPFEGPVEMLLASLVKLHTIQQTRSHRIEQSSQLEALLGGTGGGWGWGLGGGGLKKHQNPQNLQCLQNLQSLQNLQNLQNPLAPNRNICRFVWTWTPVNTKVSLFSPPSSINIEIKLKFIGKSVKMRRFRYFRPPRLH